ncbi:MAG TPA: nitric oxide reductase [Nitrospirales bacterium]|nr:nitric oxide reductase [Nitrospirales bacterium]HIC04701.1 nitric oxide reductase [Nitrospirales bacterium]HIO69690.1 nitric oxide reductase [Nitrospirales bacterium]
MDLLKNKPLLFKLWIGLLGAILVLLALNNYRVNFSGNSRLLPVSLGLFTAATFMLGIYFQKVRVVMHGAAFMIVVAAAFAGFANWLPQTIGEPPALEESVEDITSLSPQELADLGEKLTFGKGKCSLCHVFGSSEHGERAPNMFGLAARANEIVQLDSYKNRDTIQTVAYDGSGIAENAVEYMAESHACPNCYVSPGYGKRGTNDRESPMPAIHKPPLSLTIDEMVAIDTWMYVREGLDAPPIDDMRLAYEKFIPEDERPQASAGGEEAGSGGENPLLTTGNEPLPDLFEKAQCTICHIIPGIPGADDADFGPELYVKTSAPKRMKDKGYTGAASSVQEYILESIMDPNLYVVPDFDEDLMPDDFGTTLNAKTLFRIINYISQLEEGKTPPDYEKM